MKWLLFCVIFGITLTGSCAMATEEPAFKSILKEGNFEIRDYPELVIAEVSVTGDQKEAASKGFRLLAGYIFGGNKRRQGIAMTAPVAQQRAGEKIAMTAPVTQSRNAGEWIVQFTMPSSYSLQALPEPTDHRVHLKVVAPSRVAVLQFSGLARAEDVATRTNELVALVKSHGMHGTGPIALAQYNPPWTLWFMRRNEVMVPVAQ